jgi:hypothetical protein
MAFDLFASISSENLTASFNAHLVGDTVQRHQEEFTITIETLMPVVVNG